MNRGFVKYEAGVYAAPSTAGKIVLYLTAPLLMVVLPETVQRHTLQGDGRSVLMRGLLYVGIAGATIVAMYLLAPVAVIRTLFGSAYRDAAPLLSVLGLGMPGYELALLGVFYKLGRDPGLLRWVVGLSVTFAALVWIFRGSVQSVALLVATLGVGAFTGVWWSLLRAESAGTGLGFGRAVAWDEGSGTKLLP